MTGDLPTRFRDRLRALGLDAEGAHVLVALSGGMDSVVLLYLFRFAAVRVTAAHFDHAMRPGSDADARWVRGLCLAWEVPLIEGRADQTLRTEDDARRARYRFLRNARDRAGATHLATAHHADDQAETVLFRILRGTGVAGLAGIPETDEGGIVRPLLPFWREELARYAREGGLRWRDDPTNESSGPARNQIRRELLPRIESTLAPAARRSLVRLARIARAHEEEWAVLVRRAARECVRWEGDRAVLVRDRLAAYDWPVAARVLRGVLRRVGVAPGRAGTRSALQFITLSPSGRVFALPGGTHQIRGEFGAAWVEPVGEAPAADRFLVIDGPAGEGALRVAGRELHVRWRTGDWGGEEVALAVAGFPLALRGWLPGDRIATRAGTKKLKKLFLEARIPRHQRGRIPVLADAAGRVLWAAGIARAADAEPPPGEAALILSITDA